MLFALFVSSFHLLSWDYGLASKQVEKKTGSAPLQGHFMHFSLFAMTSPVLEPESYSPVYIPSGAQAIRACLVFLIEEIGDVEKDLHMLSEFP